jgi:hypothetical protein
MHTNPEGKGEEVLLDVTVYVDSVFGTFGPVQFPRAFCPERELGSLHV